MASLLSNLLDNITEGIHVNANIDMMIKSEKRVELQYKDCKCCLEYTNVKNDLILYKCLYWNRNYQNKLMKI